MSFFGGMSSTISTEVQEGSWVISKSRRALGPGKLVSSAKGSAVVEYFEAPGREVQPRREYRLDDIERYQAFRETRVHHRDPRALTWRAGRLLDEIPEGWIVQFPNREREEIPERDLFIRWRVPIEDPIDNLAAQIPETPYFHDRRADFIRSTIAQTSMPWAASATGC